MKRRSSIPGVWLALVAACWAQNAGQSAAQDASRDVIWTPREAEHLLARAGFGARTAEIQQAVEMGREACVERLLAGPDLMDDPFYARPLVRRLYAMQGMEEEERREVIRMRRRSDRRQMDDFLSWWVERMVDGRDPLRERMTLFWHGHFTSSYDAVRDSYEMVMQNQLFRTRGLGSFKDLLHGVLRDPAMLDYLNNDTNRWESPNENLARELLELFTLGEGNYSENDIQEVARALTGWTVRKGRFRVDTSQHDPDEKTILGETGNFDGNDVVEILMRQKSCALHLAGRLIAWFEGVEPEETRRAEYAALLVDNDYELRPFLRELFLDERFYRDAVVGARVAGPIDYLVGSVRRLGVRPPGRFLVVGSALLGERLFHPPNVKGWEGGEAWITTSTLMQRSNLIGILLGLISLDDFLDDDFDPLTMEPQVAEAASMMASREDLSDGERLGSLRALRGLPGVAVHGRLNLSARLERAHVEDESAAVDFLADELLVGDVDAITRRELARFLATARREAGLSRRELFREPYPGEGILRRCAHLLLSLPEAQLH